MRDGVTIPRLVVAGTRTGSGKTSVAMGLIAALSKRGRTVQSFKVGPDLIDSAYLSHLSRRPCRNLDAWMLGEEGVRQSLLNGTQGADAAIIVGAKGLFDGNGGASSEFAGSTAEVAHLTGSPVVLILDAGSMGETAAAIALGIRGYDPSLHLLGVILNNMHSANRRRAIEDAIWERARLPVLGAIPHVAEATLRTLPTTLVPLDDNPDADRAMDEMAAAMERHCDLDLIERLMASAKPMSVSPRHRRQSGAAPVRIGVAFDDAFSSYYPENLELLEEAGAEILAFSPLNERSVPREADALYFGGGITESQLELLAGNRPLIDSLRRAHAHGIPIYAESGGIAVCAETVVTSDGMAHGLAGLIPISLGMNSGICHLGCRSLVISQDCLIGDAGTELRGYEFHTHDLLRGTDELEAAYAVHDSEGEPLGLEGWTTGNLLASRVHVHFGQDAGLAGTFVRRCRVAREERDALLGVAP